MLPRAVTRSLAIAACAGLALAGMVHAPRAASAPPGGAPAAAADSVLTTAVVVRHAEKDTNWVGVDPPLTAAGMRRAAELAHVLADSRVDEIWVTHFRRNRDTAAPLAAANGDSIEVVDQADADALAARLWTRERGRTVLVVGHSDTVPQILASLTGRPWPAHTAIRYDDLFVITRRGREAPHLTHLRYGAP
jgi:broad specificity phosphatase PhoE